MLTTTVAGRTWNFSHAVGRNAAAGNGFTLPTALALVPEGRSYVLSRGSEGAGDVVADNKRIGIVTIDEEFIGDFARLELTWPDGLAVDRAGDVYCSDQYTNRIMRHSADGERLGEWGEAGSGEGQFKGLSGLAFDGEENLFVVDSQNDRVQKFTKDGEHRATWGESGSGEGQFHRPWGITIDKDGSVYVVDWGNGRCQKFSSDGEFLLSFGSSDGQAGDDLDHPADVAVDSEGDVYVTDWGNKRVQIFDPDGGVVTSLWGDAQGFSKWAREVVESNPDVVKAYRRVKDRSPLGKFNRPVGIEVDDQDRIIVTDSTRGRLQVYQKEIDYLDPQFNL